ncbi:hypothetical protein KM043_004539 [Ampulex compressa]|nr:hypothetical protein KM043_004539 [Ampulex compressa]
MALRLGEPSSLQVGIGPLLHVVGPRKIISIPITLQVALPETVDSSQPAGFPPNAKEKKVRPASDILNVLYHRYTQTRHRQTQASTSGAFQSLTIGSVEHGQSWIGYDARRAAQKSRPVTDV